MIFVCGMFDGTGQETGQRNPDFIIIESPPCDSLAVIHKFEIKPRQNQSRLGPLRLGPLLSFHRAKSRRMVTTGDWRKFRAESPLFKERRTLADEISF